MTTTEPVQILVVCTANQCRSPMAEALLTAGLATRGVPAVVRSAGVLANEPFPATPESVAAMADYSIDLSNHRSRPLDAQLAGSAHLVLAMAREHLREVVVLEPATFDRAFTLRALVRLTDAHPRTRESLSAWLARFAREREPEDLLGSSALDDIDDPVGLGLGAARETAQTLAALVNRLIRAAWPTN